jgi:hypothetical protein
MYKLFIINRVGGKEYLSFEIYFFHKYLFGIKLFICYSNNFLGSISIRSSNRERIIDNTITYIHIAHAS